MAVGIQGGLLASLAERNGYSKDDRSVTIMSTGDPSEHVSLYRESSHARIAREEGVN
jgi:hypothetical protein